MVRGEQGMESGSLMLSSMEEVSERRESSRGARPVEKVRTRGEPQTSSQPRSLVSADFCNRGTHKKYLLSHDGKRFLRGQMNFPQ